MKFLRNLAASVLGTILTLFIICMLFVAIASIAGSEEKISVDEQSVLVLALEAPVKDYAPKSGDPLDELFNLSEEKTDLNQLLNALENASTDDRIKGISIRTNGVNAGMSQTHAIRRKLAAFKETGKFILSYADFYDQKTYYLSSVADTVYVHPAGAVDFKGLSGEILYYKDLQDKTGISMEVVRHGKYKSAVEPYLANKMSAENREQITAFLQSIWNELLADISESRAISTDKLNDIADKLLGRNASLATQNNLVDAAVYWDEYEQRLKQAVGIDSDESLETISIQDYIATGKGRILSKGTDKIAVIYAQGEIQYGKGNEDIIGQDLMIEALKKVRKDSKVKAVVLRVNSPGGSALASELIWRELALTKEKLPLVVSMGDVAASGGYYLACNADKIIAEPTTITGSIGVFGVLPNASKLADNIGINAEQVSTNQGATYSIFEPMSPAFRSVTKEGVEQVYDTFLKRVSDGRNMTVEAVDKVAQGRVWAGVEALEAGLVDGLGGLEEAIAQAAKLADISTYKIRSYPRYQVAIQDKLNSFPFLRSKEDILQETLGEEAHQLYSRVRSFSRVKGVQARMPFALEIR